MREIVEVDGVEVVVEGSGPETLLMLHGWPDTLRLWDGAVTALEDRFRCCRFTLPGYAPGSPRQRPTLASMTDFLLRVVDRVSPGAPVTLVLHDWGCVFGYQFALRHPARVRRIVGVDVGDVEALPKALHLPQLLGIAGYQLWLALAWRIGGAVGDGMTRWMAGLVHARSDPQWIASRMNWPYDLAWFGGREALSRHALPFRPACPMLFIHGKRKPFPFHTEAWAEWIATQPGSRVEGFDTGHWVMLSAPERFHQVVREWLMSAP